MSAEIYNKLVKRLDNLLTKGKISRVEWREERWKLLQAARPATHARIIGL